MYKRSLRSLFEQKRSYRITYCLVVFFSKQDIIICNYISLVSTFCTEYRVQARYIAMCFIIFVTALKRMLIDVIFSSKQDSKEVLGLY